jgi:predicted RNA-binding Zn ribbon-like protein
MESVRSKIKMNHYEYETGVLAEDLINTYDTFLEVPEELQTPDDLHAFLDRHHFPVDHPPTFANLEAVRLLRETLRSIWNAETINAATESLNRLFASIRATPYIMEGTADTIHLTFAAEPQHSFMERLTLASALDMVRLLQTHGLGRLRHCDSAPCHDVFIDTSRNRTRRFCDDRCASRYNVAAFRERQRGGNNK